MRTVPSSDVRGWARRAGFIVLAALCVTGMLATAASAQAVAAKKPKPKPPSAKSISSALTAGEKASFSVTYAIKMGTVSGTFVYAQKPPNYSLTYSTKEGTFEFIVIGKTAYGCELVAGMHMCSKEPVAVAAGDLSLFQPAYVAPRLEAFVAGAKGITTSKATFDKQPSNCASGKYDGVKTTYCVTDKGFLAYVGTNAGSIHLSGYGGSPSAIALPKGAKIG